MSFLKPAYGSILVTVIVLALALVAGNAVGQVQAAPVRAPLAAPHAESQGAVGEVSGTALPGDAVRVTQGDALIGETTAGKDGAWQVPIPKTASATAPYHVQILPAAERGAAPEEPVSIVVIVVVGTNKVEVRVQVISPNGQVDIEVQVPINPPCETEGAKTQAQDAATQAQPTAEAAAAPVYHQVRAGETLAIIGARYGVSPLAIMQANKLRNANLIFVGQRLLIPAR